MAAALFAVVTLSCTPSVPDKYLQPDEMEDILFDYYLSQAVANQTQTRAQTAYNRYAYYNAVLKKHGVTEADFDSSLVYYYANADRLYEIYKKLAERIEDEATGLGASFGDISQFSTLSASGDTANIWQESQFVMLTPAPPNNKFCFTIKADTTFRLGDSFQFNFMADFMYQAGTKDAVAYIAVRYSNDSVSTHVTHVGVSGISRLRIPGNQKEKVKTIDGFLYLNRGNDDSKTLKLMFASQIQFVKFRQKSAPVLQPAKRDSLVKTGPDSLERMSDKPQAVVTTIRKK